MRFDADGFALQFSILKQNVNGRPLHYLDNAATSQMPDCVIEAVAHHDQTRRANVRRGIHHLSEQADAAYEAAREAGCPLSGGRKGRRGRLYRRDDRRHQPAGIRPGRRPQARRRGS